MKKLSALAALATAVFLVATPSGAASAQGVGGNAAGHAGPKALPPGRLRSRIESLPPRARERALEWLQRFDFAEHDVDHLAVDPEGGIFYADRYVPEDPEQMEAVEAPSNHPVATAAEAFGLHSRPGASRILFLDFDGHSITGSAWNSGRTDPLVARAFDLDGDPSSYSAEETARIGEIWHRVAEDLAPFDIDVTTEQPPGFGPHVGHVLITRDDDAFGNAMPAQGAGGVAYVGVFGSNSYGYYSPALVYFDNLGNGHPPYVAEAASHEFGHNLGLSHDGGSGGAYYTGHGSGFVSWAPIMGVGYYSNVTQWSRGEYAGATNLQDDLAIIASRIGYLADDHSDSFSGATPLLVSADGSVDASNPQTDPDNLFPENKGVIEESVDSDVFSLDLSSGLLELNVTAAWDAYYRGSLRGANLDVWAQLYDQAGNLIADSDPLDDTGASFSLALNAGRYYLVVTGTGNPISPYSDYASLGQYFVWGSVLPAAVDDTPPNPNPMTWAEAPAPLSNSSIRMTATTALDDSGVVQYRFETCDSGGACSVSQWQSGTGYTATGLEGHTAYGLRTKARDASGNETGWSAPVYASTPNAAPVALDDSDTVVPGGSIAIQVLANDSDADGDPLHIDGIIPPGNGSVSQVGDALVYTPDASFVGADSFAYTVSDGFGGSASASVSVVVETPPTRPEAPTGVSATDRQDGSASIAWTDASANEDGFEVERQTRHKRRNSWTGTAIVAATAANATAIVNAAGSGTYRYRVRSVNALGASSWSAWAQVTITLSSGGGGGGGGKCHPKKGC